MSNLHVEVLKYARDAIASKREDYVCIPIRFGKYRDTYAADEILQWIHDSLYPHNVLSDWLNYEKYISTKVGNRSDLLRECRLRWIDWMIENHTIFDDVEVR